MENSNISFFYYIELDDVKTVTLNGMEFEYDAFIKNKLQMKK